MSYDEYCRLHMACLDMARQASLPDVRARWLAMADAWLKVATDLRERSYFRGGNVSTGCAYTDSPSRGPPLCAAPSFNNRQLVFASN